MSYSLVVRFGFALGLVVLSVAANARSSSAAEKQRQIWVTNAFGNDVHIFDAATLELVRRIDVGPNPHGISATADGRTVHIALEHFRKPEGELLWLDAATGKTTGRLTIGPLPNENECTPDGKWIYVPCEDGNYWVIDGEKKTVAAKIKTGGRPHNTTISPDGKRMYLSPMGTPRRVTVVDIAAGHKVVGEIPFDDSVRPPAISSDEKRFFQNIDGLLGFQVADIAARKLVRTVKHDIAAELKEKPSRCHGLCVRPDQKEIWSCNVMHQTVHIHELTSGNYSEVAKIEMPGLIYWVTFTPDSKYGLVSVRSVGKVAVVDCESKKIVKLLECGKEPKRTQVIDVPVSAAK
jgi:DNA-binding beta-propeller fold protein YncE